MKKVRLTFMMGILLASMTVTAQEEGFVSLFNGKNLDGWHIENAVKDTPIPPFIVDKGAIASTVQSGYPCWLRSDKTYENYDLRFEFLFKGWVNGGVFFNAPRYGRLSKVGFLYQIYHERRDHLTPHHCGGIYGVLPPLENAVGPRDTWNTGRVLMDWPHLKMWCNDILVQDVNVEKNPELKYRLRQGYIGIQDVDYKLWYRNIRIKELPSKEKWQPLFNGKNFEGWYKEGTGAKWSVRDGVIHADDNGSYLVSEDVFENFELQTYVRTDRNANGGIFFRWNTLEGGDRGNEIQIENVPDSPHPTGSLYNIVASEQPYYEVGKWFLMQIRVEGTHVAVRVNGETTVDYDGLTIVRPGHISLQMHHDGKWVEWRDIKIKRL